MAHYSVAETPKWQCWTTIDSIGDRRGQRLLQYDSQVRAFRNLGYLRNELCTKEHSFIHSFILLLSSFYTRGFALREFPIQQDRKDPQLSVIWCGKCLTEVKVCYSGNPEVRGIHSVWGPWNAKVYKCHFQMTFRKAIEEMTFELVLKEWEHIWCHLWCMMFRVTAALSFPVELKAGPWKSLQCWKEHAW